LKKPSRPPPACRVCWAAFGVPEIVYPKIDVEMFRRRSPVVGVLAGKAPRCASKSRRNMSTESALEINLQSCEMRSCIKPT
jgi:hypothetical protein